MKVAIQLHRPYDREPHDHSYGDPFDSELDKAVGGSDWRSRSTEPDGVDHPTARLADRAIKVELHEDGPVFEFFARALHELPDYIAALASLVSAWITVRARRARELPEDDIFARSGYVIRIDGTEARTTTTLTTRELSEFAMVLGEAQERRSRANATGAMAKTRDLARGVVRFAKLERVLASVCALIPLFLISGDHWTLRPSISSYYDMATSPVFYVPLTVAAMLFVVNGVVKRRSPYNLGLGILLGGVIVFNHDDFVVLHAVCAAGFFLGNGIVILVFSSKKELWFKAVLVSAMAAAILAWWPLGFISLFWAEAFSLAIIALHYVLESLGLID